MKTFVEPDLRPGWNIFTDGKLPLSMCRWKTMPLWTDAFALYWIGPLVRYTWYCLPHLALASWVLPRQGTFSEHWLPEILQLDVQPATEPRTIFLQVRCPYRPFPITDLLTYVLHLQSAFLAETQGKLYNLKQWNKSSIWIQPHSATKLDYKTREAHFQNKYHA